MSSVPPLVSALVPGFRLDRYELLCPIAEGGMASVWIARLQGKRGFEKLFAVKTILAKYAKDAHFEQMFLDEARIASAIEHVNVAQILELGEEHDVLFLVMEYVDGDALSKFHRALEKKNQRFPHAILLRLMADACAGLHAAHELRDPEGQLLNVVHRDVSPQNILVNSKGVAKIVDFGIAKARDRLAGDTNTGALKGKVLYMAPEQATGRSIDRRADIWAVGAVLYHLLAGRAPFDADNQMISLHMLTSRQPPDPLPANVPSSITDIVARALAWEPTDRYATAAEMQHAIEAALAQIGAPSSDDVAAFVREQIGDRLDERKRELQAAMAAAAERAGGANSTGSFQVPVGAPRPASIPSIGGASYPSESGSNAATPSLYTSGNRSSATSRVWLSIASLGALAAAIAFFALRASSQAPTDAHGGPAGSGPTTLTASPSSDAATPPVDAQSLVVITPPVASSSSSVPLAVASAAPSSSSSSLTGRPVPVARPRPISRPMTSTTTDTPPISAPAPPPIDPAATRK